MKHPTNGEEHGDARRVDDIGLSASFSEPARQSKDITSRSIGDDDAFNLTSSPNDFLTPSVQKLQEFVLVGLQLLERLALDARDHSRDKPTRLAHLDNDNKRAILVQGGEGSAEIVRLQHRALHRIVRQRRKCHAFAARPIRSSRQNPPSGATAQFSCGIGRSLFETKVDQSENSQQVPKNHLQLASISMYAYIALRCIT